MSIVAMEDASEPGDKCLYGFVWVANGHAITMSSSCRHESKAIASPFVALALLSVLSRPIYAAL